MTKHHITLTTALILLIASLTGSTALITRESRLTRGYDTPTPTLDARPPHPWGINVGLLSMGDGQQIALDEIAAAGFGWVRQLFHPVSGDEGRWEITDRIVEGVADHDLRLIAVLQNPDTLTPPNPDTFAEFAGEFATRYAGQVAVYQIWDEPNLYAGWGGQPNPAAYLRLLQASADAIRAADPDAYILLAGLAPTTERGPDNLSDLLYLEALYALGAAPWFDGVAAKPYGFSSSPDDRAVSPDVLNFSRMVAMREVMVAAGDGDTLLWASHFGWNHLPNDWAGPPSPWGQVSAEEQAIYTVDALQRAAHEWPWAGVMVLERYDSAGLSSVPRQGFAVNNTPAWDTLAEYLTGQAGLAAGNHPAQNAYAQYNGDWLFSDLGADIPQFGEATITLDFEGSDLGIITRRDNYRAYLYAEIDGQPANALPLDENGDAYAVLTSGDYLPHTEIIWLARGLDPGPHTAVIRAERGWQQWAIAGFSVANARHTPGAAWVVAGLVLLAILSAAGVWHSARQTGSGQRLRAWFERLGQRAQFALAAALTALLWASAWLTWGSDLAQTVRRYGDTLPLLVTLLSAGVFYFSPWLLLTLLSMGLLFALLYLRPEFAIALIAFAAPFYLQPRPLFERVFSIAEVVTLLAAAVLALHLAARWRSMRFALRWPLLSGMDWAVGAFTLLSLGGMFSADLFGVALTEFRTMVIEPVLLYALLRLLPLGERDIWRAVDLWVLGGVLVAAIGLWQYATGANLITAEAGVARLRSVYGSPNNVGLYLGRIVPVAAAVALMGRHNLRRVAYGVGGVVMLAALVLSFSRGALLLGIPAALAVVLLFWQGRRAALALAGLAGAGLLALIPLSKHPRFAELRDLSTGTTFFRLNLWRSALEIIREHPWTGVGLDNFLYAYRGRYIAPAAWENPDLSHAHNWLLDYAARLGLPGLAVGLWLVGLAVRAGWRATQRLRDPSLRALAVGLLGSLADFAGHGLVDASYWFIDLAFVFMLTMGLLSWLECRSTEENEPQPAI